MAGRQEVEEKVKKLLHLYFTQITEGCGYEYCKNIYCKSGAGRQMPNNPNVAAALALKLWACKSKLCITNEDIKIKHELEKLETCALELENRLETNFVSLIWDTTTIPFPEILKESALEFINFITNVFTKKINNATFNQMFFVVRLDDVNGSFWKKLCESYHVVPIPKSTNTIDKIHQVCTQLEATGIPPMSLVMITNDFWIMGYAKACKIPTMVVSSSSLFENLSHVDLQDIIKDYVKEQHLNASRSMIATTDPVVSISERKNRIKQLLEKIKEKKSRYTPSIKKKRILSWDLENVSISKKLEKNIKEFARFLKNHYTDELFTVTFCFVAYDLTLVSEEFTSELAKEMIVVMSSGGPESADYKIMNMNQQIFRLARAPCSILLLTGDGDFHPDIRVCKMRNMDICLVHSSSIKDMYRGRGYQINEIAMVIKSFKEKRNPHLL